jgi:hypothetical protein
MKKTLLFIAVFICTAQAFSTIRLVPGSYATIQAALTAAVSVDTIQVAAGTYTEKNLTLGSIKSVTLKGAGIGQTIVQAFATPNNTPAASCSVFNLDGAYSSAITITLQDMTIQNGYNSSNGGGIRFTNSGTVAPILNFANLKIANNIGLAGGGIYISGYATATISACNITANTGSSITAGNGGGIYISPGTNKLLSATIKNSSISFNTSGYLGGGMMVQCSGDANNLISNQLNHSLIIENTTIYKNSCITATKSGGGIEFRQAGSSSTYCSHTVKLNHCTIVGNTTNGGIGGDGVCFENNYNTTLIMNNSIVMGNSGATTYPSQIGILASSQAKLLNGGVSNNIIGIYVGSGSANTITTANNNKLDAVIANLAFPTLDNNALSTDATPVLLIGSSSIAKDFVGTDNIPVINQLATDQIGNPRYGNKDAGAYEYNASLVVSASATSGGSVISGTGNYASGALATLVAVANSGFSFINWTENGTAVSTSPTYTFTVSAARNLVANFSETGLTIAASAGTGGTITSGAGNYIVGAIATLVATANSGYRFANWTENGTVVSTDAFYGFTVSAARTLMANFIKTYNITVLKNSSGQFNTVTGAGTYDVNATVTLVAVPKSGYHFDNWTDANGLVSSNLSYQFTATADYSITANFTADPGTLANMFYSYTAGTSDYFYVYEKVNDNGVYRQFKIAHVVSSSINCNLWRILDSYFVQYNGSTMTQFQQILTGGENELAFKTNRTGVVEFTGGYHGDEHIDLDPSSYVRFYADGSVVPLTSSIPLTACSSFYYQQYSSVHQTGVGVKTAIDYIPVPGNPIDSYHTKKTVFENNGYTTYNNLKWINVVPINQLYYGIFCVNKDITTQATNDYGTTEVFDQLSVNRLNSDKQKIVMVNPTMGTTVTCNSFINLFPYTPSLSALILDSNVYHKYYSSLGKPTFQIGDSCSFTSTISFDYLPVTTEVNKISNDNRVKILSSNGSIQIDGLVPNEKFRLYNTSGVVVKVGGYQENIFSVKQNELYILRLELRDGVKSLKIKL